MCPTLPRASRRSQADPAQSRVVVAKYNGVAIGDAQQIKIWPRAGATSTQ